MNTAGMIVREGVKLMSNYGIGYIVGEGVKVMTPENLSTFKKVCVSVGGAAVAGYAGLKANEYIDEVADAIDVTIKQVKEMRKPKEDEVEVETTVEKEEKKEEPKKTSKKKNTTKKKKEEKTTEPKEESKVDESKEA